MGFQFNTDFSTIEPNEGAGSFFPVSDSNGWLCKMVASEGKENSAKTGQILAVKLVGLDGPIQGKTHEYTINLTNPNQEAARIGMAECSAIAHVTGHVRVGNSAEWHEKPFRVVVGVELDKEKQPTGRNRITKYLDVNGNGPKDAGKGPMSGGQQNSGAGQNFQQNNGGQQNNANWGNGNTGNQASGQPDSNGGGQGFGNNHGDQQQNAQFSNGQTGQPNNQGGVVNPGSNFQPNNNGGGFQQNGNNQGGFQQNNGGSNMGGWNR